MSHIMLHSDPTAKRVSRDQVNAVATPLRTATWQPVSHMDAIDMALSQLTELGFKVKHEEHGLMRGGSQYIGVFDLTTEGDADRMAGEGYNIALGIRNSHDKSFALKLGLGTHVWICDNKSFMAEEEVGRKHSKEILRELPGLIRTRLELLPQFKQAMDYRTEGLKKVDLDGTFGRNLMYYVGGALVAKGIWPGSKLKKVFDEYDHPSYAAFEPRNAWSLYNAFTHVLKDEPLAVMAERSRKLTALFDKIMVKVGKEQAVEKLIESDVLPQIEAHVKGLIEKGGEIGERKVGFQIPTVGPSFGPQNGGENN